MNFDGKNPYCTSRKDKNSQKLPAKIPYYERAKQDVYDHQGLKQDGKSAAEKKENHIRSYKHNLCRNLLKKMMTMNIKRRSKAKPRRTAGLSYRTNPLSDGIGE